jgi:hypothetical protein
MWLVVGGFLNVHGCDDGLLDVLLGFFSGTNFTVCGHDGTKSIFGFVFGVKI